MYHVPVYRAVLRSTLASRPLPTLPIAFDCRTTAQASSFCPKLRLCRGCGGADCREAGLIWSSRRRRGCPYLRRLRGGATCTGSRQCEILEQLSTVLLRPQAQVSSRLPGESTRMQGGLDMPRALVGAPLASSILPSIVDLLQCFCLAARRSQPSLDASPSTASEELSSRRRAWSMAEVWPAWSVQLKLTRYEFGLPQQQLPPSTRQSNTIAQTTTTSPAELQDLCLSKLEVKEGSLEDCRPTPYLAMVQLRRYPTTPPLLSHPQTLHPFPSTRGAFPRAS